MNNNDLETLEALEENFNKRKNKEDFPFIKQTAKTKHIEAIIGRDEVLAITYKTKKEDLKKYNLISISEPTEGDIDSNYLKDYKSLLQLKFMDIRCDKNPSYDEVKKYEINNKQIEELTKFILENKNNKFIIHCSVGISRSAAVGLFVEELLNETQKEKEKEQNNITTFWRYSANKLICLKLMGKTFKEYEDNSEEIF